MSGSNHGQPQRGRHFGDWRYGGEDDDSRDDRDKEIHQCVFHFRPKYLAAKFTLPAEICHKGQKTRFSTQSFLNVKMAFDPSRKMFIGPMHISTGENPVKRNILWKVTEQVSSASLRLQARGGAKLTHSTIPTTSIRLMCRITSKSFEGHKGKKVIV